MLEKTIDTRKAWTVDQDNIILSIVKQIGTKNWPLVSQLMKGKLQLSYRTGKQCRERWHNHLNPFLNKQPWSNEQQQKLFQAHRINGNRWIQISKKFSGRTDNSIKNHFYSTIRRSMRRICKILGNRNSTSKLRNIRPSILSQIFQFSKTQQFKTQGTNLMDIASCILQYAQEKPKKCSEFDPNSKSDLQNLVSRLIHLNDQYVNYKINKREKNLLKKTSNKNIQKIKISQQTIISDQISEINSTESLNQIFKKQYTNKKENQPQQQFKQNSKQYKNKIQQITFKNQIQKKQKKQQNSTFILKIQKQFVFQKQNSNIIKIQNENIIRMQYQNYKQFQFDQNFLKLNQISIFGSNKCLNKIQQQCFFNLKRPSLCFFQIQQQQIQQKQRNKQKSNSIQILSLTSFTEFEGNIFTNINQFSNI